MFTSEIGCILYIHIASLWMCVHYIETGHDNLHLVFIRTWGEINHFSKIFYSFFSIFIHICGDMITCVCHVCHLQIANCCITICKIKMWVSNILWLTHVLLSWFETFVIFTHGSHTNYSSGYAYATNTIICFSFINVTCIFPWKILLVFQN
jgi:hypothetical protein